MRWFAADSGCANDVERWGMVGLLHDIDFELYPDQHCIKAQELLARLFDYYVKHPDEMPELYCKNTKNEPVERCVCDFVGGMTDRYAIDRYTELFIPQVWRGKQL